jgi:phospholipid/cholesterol/gamma-HCH transport system permease protein
VVAQRVTAPAPTPAVRAHRIVLALEGVGRAAAGAGEQALALLAFVGESALAFAGCLAHPGRMRWRPILFNIRSAGFDALPIVGLLSFLLGIVVAYQAAEQLRRYGANIFVADLVGLSMLREFAPLMTAIIIAGRSGSAYAAQIGTMAVTEEIDAMRTIGIAPLELLVLPKVVALVIALPLLTVFADLLGVFGGMVMARVQLGVSYSVPGPLLQGHQRHLVPDRHRQGAGVRRHHRGGRLLSGHAHQGRRRQRRAPDHPRRRAGHLPGDRRRRPVLDRVQCAGAVG